MGLGAPRPSGNDRTETAKREDESFGKQLPAPGAAQKGRNPYDVGGRLRTGEKGCVCTWRRVSAGVWTSVLPSGSQRLHGEKSQSLSAMPAMPGLHHQSPDQWRATTTGHAEGTHLWAPRAVRSSRAPSSGHRTVSSGMAPRPSRQPPRGKESGPLRVDTDVHLTCRPRTLGVAGEPGATLLRKSSGKWQLHQDEARATFQTRRLSAEAPAIRLQLAFPGR